MTAATWRLRANIFELFFLNDVTRKYEIVNEHLQDENLVNFDYLEEMVMDFGGKAHRVMMTAAVCNEVSMSCHPSYRSICGH